jgi:hypothetical protein
MRIIVRTIFCAFLLSALFTGCNCNNADADPFIEEKFDAFDDSLGQRVEAYHQAVFADNANASKGKPSLYIDFSSGIYQALAKKNNLAILTNVYNSLPSTALDVFKLSSDSIVSMKHEDIDREVADPNKYKEIYAPITKAVTEIVSKKNDALLVTDFEAYEPPSSKKRAEITDIAYLKELFKDWLSKGNSIHFFISEYKENNIDKRLFFTIFSYGRVSNESLISRIETSNLISGLIRFDLSNKEFVLSQKYDAEKNGGIFYDLSQKAEKAINVLDLQNNSYINGLKKSTGNFEFYPFGLDWKTIGLQRETYKEQGQFNDFFRKIFVDISNEDSYHIEALSVKVTDVTSDFEQFAKCREVIKHQPHIGKGSNGEDKFSDTEKDLIALNCYEPSGKVKEQWIYHTEPGNDVPEVFAFNKVLFDNTAGNSDRKKAELAVSFDPKFSVKNIPSSARLLRVDIVVNKATVPAANGKMEKFSWTSTTKKPALNTALAASITNVLAEPKVKPDQHVIYSYYIKTLDN